MKEVGKGECIIIGDFNHGHIKWKTIESTGSGDQQFLLSIQDRFLTQRVLEPTSGEIVLYTVLSSQNELVDNIRIHEQLGNSEHNHIHFDYENQKVKLKNIQEKLPQR